MVTISNFVQSNFTQNDNPGVRSDAIRDANRLLSQIDEGVAPRAQINNARSGLDAAPDLELGIVNNLNNTTQRTGSTATRTASKVIKLMNKVMPGYLAMSALLIAGSGVKKMANELERANGQVLDDQAKAVDTMLSLSNEFLDLKDSVIKTNEETDHMIQDVFTLISDINAKIESINHSQHEDVEVMNEFGNTLASMNDSINNIMQADEVMINQLLQQLYQDDSKGLN